MKNRFCRTCACWLIFFCLIILPFLLAGCSQKSSSAWQGESTGDYAAASVNTNYEGTGFNSEGLSLPEATPAYTRSSGTSEDAPVSAVTQTRKLVKRAQVSVEAGESLLDGEGKLVGVNQQVEALLKKYNAYAEQTRSDENSVYYSIRVPQAFYESLLADTGTLGKVRSRSETAEDVTLKYYDMEGRLNTKKTLLATFQSYLGRTQNIDDIMKVEARIAELQNEIDWLGTQFTQLANLVDYAVIELSIISVRYVSNYTLGDRIGDLFSSFSGFASGAVLVILGIIIYGIPIIVVCLLAFWFLFGRLGLLKKAFRLVMSSDVKKRKITGA